MIKGDKPAVQQQTIRMLDALVSGHGSSYGVSTEKGTVPIKHAKAKTCPKEPEFTYSLWYGGSGAFAHAAEGGTCKSYFDVDEASQESFLSHKPDVPVFGALETILQDPDDFVERTRSVNYVHVTPPCTSYTKGGNQMGLNTRDGKQMLFFLTCWLLCRKFQWWA